MNGGFEEKREVLCITLTKSYEPTESCEVYLRAFIERLKIDDIMLYLKDVSLIPKGGSPIMPLWGVISSRLYGELIREAIQNYEIVLRPPDNSYHWQVKRIEEVRREAFRRLDRVILGDEGWQPLYDVWHGFVMGCIRERVSKRPRYDDAKFTTISYVATLEAAYNLRDD
jgi:hypothetical protein